MDIPISSASPEAFPRLLFGRHQGYTLREQWITRGLLALAKAEHPTARARLFASPEATDHFGIGPAMVAALRYWLRATGLMEEQVGNKERRPIPALTPLGALLVQHDPYLQRSGSLWLLHAHLVRNLLLAPTWYWFFQCFVRTTPFTKEECLEALLSWAIRSAPTQQIVPDVLRKDVECLLRLYTQQQQPSLLPERHLLSSPFRRLGLLQWIPAGPGVSVPHTPTRRGVTRYMLHPPSAEDIPSLVILALMLEQNPSSQHVPLTHLLYRHMQVGRTCSLKQGAFLDALQHLQQVVPDWCPRRTRFDGQEWLILPSLTAERVLLQYYQQPQ